MNTSCVPLFSQAHAIPLELRARTAHFRLPIDEYAISLLPQDPSLHQGKTNFTRLLDEVPLKVENSCLARILLRDMVGSQQQQQDTSFGNADGALSAARHASGLHLNMGANLEEQMRSLLLRLDSIHELQFSYQRTLSKLAATSPTKASYFFCLFIGFFSSRHNGHEAARAHLGPCEKPKGSNEIF